MIRARIIKEDVDFVDVQTRTMQNVYRENENPSLYL